MGFVELKSGRATLDYMEMGKLACGYRHYPRPAKLGPADYARMQPEKSEHIAHRVKAGKSAKDSRWLFLHGKKAVGIFFMQDIPTRIKNVRALPLPVPRRHYRDGKTTGHCVLEQA